MAALCTGSYGLSQNCTDNSKQYFFVKVTDSAYRAIEDYERNLNKYKTTATIQFLENGGIISFPTASENAGQQFTFAIENEGSLECIQQKQSQLDVLGTLQYKMRIHANEDVYETTRHRMAVAEETQKKKSTVEIKPNQTDIGRKVKLKTSKNRVQHIPQKRDHPQTSMTAAQFLTAPVISSNSLQNGITSIKSSSASPPRDTVNHHVSLCNATSNNLMGSSSATSILSNYSSGFSNHHFKPMQLSNSIQNNSPNSPSNCVQGHNGHTTLPTAASSLSSAFSSAAGSGTCGIINTFNNSHSNNSIKASISLNAGNACLVGVGNRKNLVTSPGNTNRSIKNTSRHSKLDITKRNIRERLIHMLALKNLKKPEILPRLLNEGIRDKEKNLISAILKEISTIRDNTFNLKRPIWNEVNENWPFYTEQDLQTLKRRKPQNLTPPLSSDCGSSTSGQSPTSTHNGSPPPGLKRSSLDRDRCYEEPAVKKQRISHFKKDGIEISSLNATNVRHQDPDDSSIGLSYSVLSTEAARRISPRDGAQMTSVHSNTGLHLIPNINHHQYSLTKNSACNNGHKNLDGNILMNSTLVCQSSSSVKNIQLGSNNTNINNNNDSSHNKNSHATKNCVLSVENQRQCLSPMNGPSAANGYRSYSPDGTIKKLQESYNSSISINDVNNATFEEDSDIHSEPSDTKSIIDSPGSKIDNCTSSDGEFFDFSGFKKITAIEQRRKYKTEFGKDYEEYKKLLNEIDRVRTRFTVLANELSKARNNDDNYRSIKKQIVDEYQRIQNQREHQNVKARFNYLHAKLAYIKTLVSDYDKTLTSEHVPSNAEIVIASSSEKSNDNRNLSSPSNNCCSNSANKIAYYNGSFSPGVNSLGTKICSGRTSAPFTPNSQHSTQLLSTVEASNEHHLPKNANY